ncbi:MAG: Organic hydroperoxide resistance transcriptional regulator, partial [uncultured Rubrobacteraceae bacterium]
GRRSRPVAWRWAAKLRDLPARPCPPRPRRPAAARPRPVPRPGAAAHAAPATGRADPVRVARRRRPRSLHGLQVAAADAGGGPPHPRAGRARPARDARVAYGQGARDAQGPRGDVVRAGAGVRRRPRPRYDRAVHSHERGDPKVHHRARRTGSRGRRSTRTNENGGRRM